MYPGHRVRTQGSSPLQQHLLTSVPRGRAKARGSGGQRVREAPPVGDGTLSQRRGGGVCPWKAEVERVAGRRSPVSCGPFSLLLSQQCDSARNLEWLKTVKESHGSVELSSLSLATAINSRGIYVIKAPTDGQKVSITSQAQLQVALTGCCPQGWGWGRLCLSKMTSDCVLFHRFPQTQFYT